MLDIYAGFQLLICTNSPYSATMTLTGSADFSAKLWANNSGDLMVDLPHKHVVRVVDLSLDNRLVLTGGLEKKVEERERERERDFIIVQSNHSKREREVSLYNSIIYVSPCLDSLV